MMGELKGLLRDFSTDWEPDFESMLSSRGSSPKQIQEIAEKGEERIHALFNLLAYWTPERLDLLALRHALEWNAPLRLGKQYERAYLHYLGWTKEVFGLAPAWDQRDRENAYPQHRIVQVREAFPGLLRELRERIEFVHRRAMDLRLIGPQEVIAAALYQREREATVAKIADIAIHWVRLSQTTDPALKKLTTLLQRQPELRYLPLETKSDLTQQILARLQARGLTEEEMRSLKNTLSAPQGRTEPNETEAFNFLDGLLHQRTA